jgi:phage terminase small subunit
MSEDAVRVGWSLLALFLFSRTSGRRPSIPGSQEDGLDTRFAQSRCAKKSVLDKEAAEQIQLGRINRWATHMPKKLTHRQRQFALAYAADPQHNGTKAALSAGCPRTSAHVMASRWLKNAEVQDLVEQFVGRMARKYELSAEKVIQELCKLAFANLADYVEINREGVAFLSLSEITRDQAAAIHEITLENCDRGDSKDPNARRALRVRLSDKVRSLELLGKFLKLFGKDNVSASETVRVIVVDSPRPRRPPIRTLENQDSAINSRDLPCAPR